LKSFSPRRASLLNNSQKLFWHISIGLLALVLTLPLISILVLAANPAGAAWPHFISSVLPHYLSQTLILLSGVGLLTLIVGVTLAWLISFYNFPWRSALQWLVLLPMAMPAYVVAFIFVDFFNYSGPLQSSLRALMGWQKPSDYYVPEIRSMAGAIIVLGFTLYPYVYLSARAIFLKQSMNQIDVARTLGKSPLQVLWGIILPQARPAIIIGLVLVLMESMNDIAAVSLFGVQTLTLGIYSAWLGQSDLGSAAQMAVVILVFLTALIYIEKRARGRSLNLIATQKQRPIQRQNLRHAWLATVLCVVPFAIGFLLPAVLLYQHAVKRLPNFINSNFLQAAGNSIAMAAAASAITLCLGLYLVYANRTTKSNIIRILTNISTIGYAIPGTIIAIGILVAFGHFDNALDNWMRLHLNLSTGLLLSGSIAALLLAYAVRFLMIGFGTLENGLEKITPNIDAVARTLGRGPFVVLRDIHLPMLRPALVTAALLVFVDAMKELPATLLLRPFGFNNLATQVYELASLEKLEDSSVPALAIVLAGLIPVILLAINLHDPAMKSPHVRGK
jgi:iron(III) transport system permease protein